MLDAFGERLSDLRKSRNLTMREMAKMLNIAISTYAGYESGDREPNLNVITQLAKFYGVSVDYLVLGKSGNDMSLEFDLKAALQKQQVMFDGVPLSEEDRRKVEDVLTGLFWEALRRKQDRSKE
ncbi:helix-turn-helix domain-containing protein [Sulfoacidibacillus thermotolerans]|nr:helix-turn-helix transcriptional regulator [Sulfoacidibacillus thermotolerans]